MNLDTFTISALADELHETIVGGRVQDVIDVDALVDRLGNLRQSR